MIGQFEIFRLTERTWRPSNVKGIGGPFAGMDGQ